MKTLITGSGFTLQTDNNRVPVAAYDAEHNLFGFAIYGKKLSDTVVMQNAASAPGDGVILPTQDYSEAILDISISGTALVKIYGQGPGGNWYQIYGFSLTQNAEENEITASDLISVNCSGLQNIRASIDSVGATPGIVAVTGITIP